LKTLDRLVCVGSFQDVKAGILNNIGRLPADQNLVFNHKNDRSPARIVGHHFPIFGESF
jgi:hypothetical protein